MADVSNMDDVIDSRDVIKRIDELQGELDALEQEVEDRENSVLIADAGEETVEAEKSLTLANAELEEWKEANQAELDDLIALQDEAEDCGDWKYGATLIRESYFVVYCQELLSDIGDIPRDLPDYLVIDWEATASNLSQDYAEVDYGGTTYMLRA